MGAKQLDILSTQLHSTHARQILSTSMRAITSAPWTHMHRCSKNDTTGQPCAALVAKRVEASGCYRELCGELVW